MQKQTKSNIAAGLSRAKRCKRRFFAVKNSNAPEGDGGWVQIAPFCRAKKLPRLEKDRKSACPKGRAVGVAHTFAKKC